MNKIKLFICFVLAAGTSVFCQSNQPVARTHEFKAKQQLFDLLKRLQNISADDARNNTLIQLSASAGKAYLNIFLITLIQAGELGDKLSDMVGWENRFIGGTAQIITLTTLLSASLVAVKKAWSTTKNNAKFVVPALFVIWLVEGLSAEMARLSKENLAAAEETYSMKIHNFIMQSESYIAEAQQLLKDVQKKVGS